LLFGAVSAVVAVGIYAVTREAEEDEYRFNVTPLVSKYDNSAMWDEIARNNKQS
jgi:hypothetical protein